LLVRRSISDAIYWSQSIRYQTVVETIERYIVES